MAGNVQIPAEGVGLSEVGVSLTATTPSLAADGPSLAAVGVSLTFAAAPDFPDASNTGYATGTVFGEPVINPDTSEDGQIIENTHIKGVLRVFNSGVIVRNCWIEANPFYGINVPGPVTVPPVIENCTFTALIPDDALTAINGYGTVRACDISQVENGMNVTGPSTIEDNYIHDLLSGGVDPHYDGIQIDGDVSDVTINHNTIICDHSSTSAIMIDNLNGAIADIAVSNNKLAGGSYTVHCDASKSASPITGVSYTDNHMGTGDFGYALFNGVSPTFTGNVDLTTGAPIPAPT